MKTKQRQKYEAPKVEVIVVELEEAIANTSPGADVDATPAARSWSQGDGDVTDHNAF